MKRYAALLTLLLCLFALAACGAAPESKTSTPAPLPPEPAASPTPVSQGEPEPEANQCQHPLSEVDHTVDHEAAGYCGNTVTAVSSAGEGWTKSFWGSKSVELTDLLRYLDYSGDVCRCPAEYTVDTEFGQGYGVNLTEGFVRHEGGQTALTAEQAERIQAVIDQLSQAEDGADLE